MSRDDDEINGLMDEFIDSRGLMSKSARDRWNRQQLERNNAILAECESGLMARILARAARENISTLDEGQQLDKATREFVNTMYALLNEYNQLTEGEDMSQYDRAHTPYVSETQTRHAPMTGTHTHDHAAHGDSSHDDGIHGGDGPHTHEADADHDHPEQHPHGHTNPGRTPQTGVYGRQMQDIGPAERAALKRAQLRRHEENR